MINNTNNSLNYRKISITSATTMALSSGAAAYLFYYNHPSSTGYSLRKLSQYINEVNKPYYSDVRPFSPYNFLKTGEISKAVANIHELEPEVRPYFYNALEFYRKIERAKGRKNLANIFSKTLKMPVNELKSGLLNNFESLFNKYMESLYQSSRLDSSKMTNIGKNLDKIAKKKATMTGLLVGWFVYQIFTLTNKHRGLNDHENYIR